MPFYIITSKNNNHHNHPEYQRYKQNFIYRNGCAKKISKKIKDIKNKK